MIVDITGTILIPGNDGKDCPGNGCIPGVECCCNECDYMLCCIDPNWYVCCPDCTEWECPRKDEPVSAHSPLDCVPKPGESPTG